MAGMSVHVRTELVVDVLVLWPVLVIGPVSDEKVTLEEFVEIALEFTLLV
jgi:hypothetical protein